MKYRISPAFISLLWAVLPLYAEGNKPCNVNRLRIAAQNFGGFIARPYTIYDSEWCNDVHEGTERASGAYGCAGFGCTDAYTTGSVSLGEGNRSHSEKVLTSLVGFVRVRHCACADEWGRLLIRSINQLLK